METPTTTLISSDSGKESTETLEITVTEGYSYRLSPDIKTVSKLNQHSGNCRWIKNEYISIAKDFYLMAKSAGGKPIGLTPQFIEDCIFNKFKASHQWLKLGSSTAQQQALSDVVTAFDQFFKNKKGYPRHHPRGDDDSFRLTFPNFKLNTKEAKIKIPKIGWISYIKSRSLPPASKINNVTVKREGYHWNIVLNVTYKTKTMPKSHLPDVGIDLGIVNSVCLSTGEIFKFPVATKQETKFLKKLQRKISKKQKGSRRKKKLQARYNKHARRISRRVTQTQHIVSNYIVDNFNDLHLEGLKLKNMTGLAKVPLANPGKKVKQKSGLNRNLLQQKLGGFKNILTYKVIKSGSKLHFKDPKHSSQKCFKCKKIDKNNRKTQADFVCLSCGHTANADHNSANNMFDQPLLKTVKYELKTKKNKFLKSRKLKKDLALAKANLLNNTRDFLSNLPNQNILDYLIFNMDNELSPNSTRQDMPCLHSLHANPNTTPPFREGEVS
jgi:putative transposase